MQRTALTLYTRCRRSVFQSDNFQALFKGGVQLDIRRSRGTSSKKRTYSPTGKPSALYKRSGAPFHPGFPEEHRVSLPDVTAGRQQVIDFFTANVAKWSRSQLLHRRLKGFGIAEDDIPRLLKVYVEQVEAGASGLLSRPDAFEWYNLGRFTDALSSSIASTHMDRVYTSILFRWAYTSDSALILDANVSAASLDRIRRLSAITDLSFPADAYPRARSMKRKIIMHVGPTNSGKTHMALRALAAAESGVYAGPLRLLAHEIWERLNFGQIVPLGVDPEADAEPDTDSNIDVGPTSKQPTIQKRGNPKYARECNMLTGEETKIVSENSMLSCTVEMIPLGTMFDVAVVDEVQLLADPERGFAWTQAILGLSAKEIHLCGEEAAVPLVQAMMEETGDEVIVNRYQRLTPLTVQDQSLNGQLSQVRKGDCIVTFSRSGIFRLKKKVEELTGLRCAVAYGRLPPEIRSEQAALFNDPDSGYDVMIGSDAIGMGLNLKIKRVVFDSVHKWNGYEETVISNAQIKQIAGRAGRYGLHGDDASGGYVTTLEPKDLPILRAALAEPAGGLPAARVGFDSLEKLFDFLDPPVRTQLLLDAQLYTAHVRSIYRCAESSKMNIRSRFIDTLGNLLPRERSILLQAPIPWQDTNYLQYVAKLMRTYVNDTTVDLSRFLTTTGMMETLEDVEKGMVDDTWTQSSHETLGGLELLHKTIVLYMWLGQRSPLSFPDNEHVHDIKARTEKALDWCLQGIAWGKTPRFSHREVQAVRQRRDADGKISWVSKRDYRMKKEAEEHRPGASYPKHHKTAPSPSWAN